MLNVCASCGGKLDIANQIFSEMDTFSWLRPDKRTYSTMLKVCARTGTNTALSIARDYLKKAEDANFANTITYSTMLDVYASCGAPLEEAQGLFEKMWDQSWSRPNVTTYNTMLKVYLSEGSDKGVGLAQEMLAEKHGMLNAVSYHIFLQILLHGGEFSRGINIVRKMLLTNGLPGTNSVAVLSFRSILHFCSNPRRKKITDPNFSPSNVAGEILELLWEHDPSYVPSWSAKRLLSEIYEADTSLGDDDANACISNLLPSPSLSAPEGEEGSDSENVDISGDGSDDTEPSGDATADALSYGEDKSITEMAEVESLGRRVATISLADSDAATHWVSPLQLRFTHDSINANFHPFRDVLTGNLVTKKSVLDSALEVQEAMRTNSKQNVAALFEPLDVCTVGGSTMYVAGSGNHRLLMWRLLALFSKTDSRNTKIQVRLVECKGRSFDRKLTSTCEGKWIQVRHARGLYYVGTKKTFDRKWASQGDDPIKVRSWF